MQVPNLESFSHGHFARTVIQRTLQEYNIYVKYQAAGKWKSFAKGRIDLAKFATADRDDVVSKKVEVQLLKEVRGSTAIAHHGASQRQNRQHRRLSVASHTPFAAGQFSDDTRPLPRAPSQAGIELKGKSRASNVTLQLTVKCFVREKKKGAQQVREVAQGETEKKTILETRARRIGVLGSIESSPNKRPRP